MNRPLGVRVGDDEHFVPRAIRGSVTPGGLVQQRAVAGDVVGERVATAVRITLRGAAPGDVVNTGDAVAASIELERLLPSGVEGERDRPRHQ